MDANAKPETIANVIFHLTLLHPFAERFKYCLLQGMGKRRRL